MAPASAKEEMAGLHVGPCTGGSGDDGGGGRGGGGKEDPEWIKKAMQQAAGRPRVDVGGTNIDIWEKRDEAKKKTNATPRPPPFPPPPTTPPGPGCYATGECLGLGN